jgi:Arc/MetJ-type ribon-helix-helix transcriptional regulator
MGDAERIRINAELRPPLISMVGRLREMGYSNSEIVREGIRCFWQKKQAEMHACPAQ